MRRFGSSSAGIFRPRYRGVLRAKSRDRAGQPFPSRNGISRMARRPAAPRFWPNIAPAIRARSIPASGNAGVAERTRYWRLVLDAKNIPWRLYGREIVSLYVPPAAALAAIHEITAFETEKPVPPVPHPVQKPGAFRILAMFALLAVWHRLRWDAALHPSGFFGLPADGRSWLEIAGLDTYRVTALHEWWRCFTALTLHADAAHLVSNIVTGTVFCIPLCRYAGVGLGFCLVVLAGAFGNALTALLRTTPHLSQGFSTAVFASAGLLAAIAASLAFVHTLAATHAVTPGARGEKAALKQALFEGMIPLAAGLGLLAMFGGSDSPRVDYLAHAMGLAAGIGIGLFIGIFRPKLLTLRGKKETLLQAGALIFGIALLAAAWVRAAHAV